MSIPKGQQTTRKRLLSEAIQKAREAVILREFEIKVMESADEKLTSREKSIIFTDLTIDSLKERLEQLKAFHSLELIRLETLKEMRDGKPDIDTEENRELVRNSPIVKVEKK